MKKILIVSTVSRQFYLFEQANIEVLKSLGYEVHGAASFEDANQRLDALEIVRHPIDIQRSPFSLKNIKAYKQLKKIMRTENFDAVHCHSPMGGVLARLAAKAVGVKKVIYTAHGFHFYKGAPLFNWVFYYPVEFVLSKFTDVLITINSEDYKLAKEFKSRKVEYVPGIGVDTLKFSRNNNERKSIREKLEISDETIVLLSIGELIKRKNHETALEALAKIKHDNFMYLICGKGELEIYLRKKASDLKIDDKVKFLGYRNDIHEICQASDIFLFPSYQEGLPVSLMEAMASGLPIICSEIRGNIDLVENNKNGYLIKPDDVNDYAVNIETLVKNHNLRMKMGELNIQLVKEYDKNVIKASMMNIYCSILL